MTAPIRDARAVIASIDAPAAAALPEVAPVAPAPPDPDNIDLTAWFTAHGATAPEYEEAYGCSEHVVGAAHEPAVLCTLIEDATRPIPGSDEPAYRIVERNTLRVVRSHAIVTVLDVSLRHAALDAPPPRRDAPAPTETVTIATDGMSIHVVTANDERCKSAPRAAPIFRAGVDPKVERVWAALLDELDKRICASRGRWVWRNGRFAH